MNGFFDAHTTQDGSEIAIRHMDNQHLVNYINLALDRLEEVHPDNLKQGYNDDILSQFGTLSPVDLHHARIEAKATFVAQMDRLLPYLVVMSLRNLPQAEAIFDDIAHILGEGTFAARGYRAIKSRRKLPTRDDVMQALEEEIDIE